MASRCLVVWHLTFYALFAANTVRAGLWSVSIDEGPAPAPEDGPPFSAHASRDRALLPAQICGVVGAYLGSILIIGILLLTVGRRLRREAQSSQGTLAMEMVKPTNTAFSPSIHSPASETRSWYSPRKMKSFKKRPGATDSLRSGRSPTSPSGESVISFDPSVVEADKAARQREMEALYAAVMAHDDRKSEGTVREIEIAPLSPHLARRQPPRIMTSGHALTRLNIPSNPASPATPHTPKSPIRAIYPPDSSMPPMPSSPTSPIRADYPTTPLTPHYVPQAPRGNTHAGRERMSGTPSTGSQTSEVTTTRQKLRKSLRNLRISAPLQKYPVEDDDSGRTPLSPRLYMGMDPGIPPEPPTAGTATPGTHGGHGWQNDEEEIDQIRDLPRAAPQRPTSYGYNNTAQIITDAQNAISPRPAITSMAANTGNSQLASDLPLRAAVNKSSSSTPNALPLRNTEQDPSGFTFTPLSPSMPLRSPYALKTTFLSPRRDAFLQGPGTGMQTPYSPYMPFTPITPVTPHLTSRAERRQREREEGRRVLRQEDAVVEEDEMWGSAY